MKYINDRQLNVGVYQPSFNCSSRSKIYQTGLMAFMNK